MADPTLTPQQIQTRLASLLSTATADRSSLLLSFADDAQQEAASLRKVRDALAQSAGANDPTVQALDRRATGTDQVTAFIRQTLEKTGVPSTPPPLGDWVVAGFVLGTGSRPVAGAKITLSGDPDLAELFGGLTSDKEGKFEIRLPGAELSDIFARAPKVKLAVRSKDGKRQATTAEIVPKSDGIDLHEIRLGKPATKRDDREPDERPADDRTAPAADEKA
jgi:hypothetical protein